MAQTKAFLMHHVHSGTSKKTASVITFFSSTPPPPPSFSPGQSKTCTATAATRWGCRQPWAASPESQLEQLCLSEQGSRALSPSLSHPTTCSPARGTAPRVLGASMQTGTSVVTPQPFGAFPAFLGSFFLLNFFRGT